jgi:hypothetical protein
MKNTNVTALLAAFTLAPVGLRTQELFEISNVNSSMVLDVPAVRPQAVLTYHYDNARSGFDPEPEFGVWHGNISKFGKLFAHAVDGQVYAQPLYVPQLAIPDPYFEGKETEIPIHNVVFIATEADSVFAFDADSNKPPNDNYLWKASLIDADHGAARYASAVNTSDLSKFFPNQCTNIEPAIGITSTPMIDPATFTMYVEAKSRELDPVSGSFIMVHRLHALDIRTGKEKLPGPRVIATAGFDAVHQLNRPGLLLSQGMVYVGFGSHCDQGPYHGWLFAYDARTLEQKAAFKVPTAHGGAGIWMSGAGLAADSAGNLFVATGNASNVDTGGDGLGDSILKLDKDLKLTAIYTPINQYDLGLNDNDLGSGGVLLLPDQGGPHPHLAVQAGKEGKISLIDRDLVNVVAPILGEKSPSWNVHRFVQTIANAVGKPFYAGGPPCSSPGYGCVFGMPAFWNGTLYFTGSFDVLKAFSLADGVLSQTPAQSDASYTSSIQKGLAITTSNVGGATYGIVWSLELTDTGASRLQAYDAEPHQGFITVLYSSDMRKEDAPGKAVKFTVPTAVNGKVYVGASGEVSVYGLMP